MHEPRVGGQRVYDLVNKVAVYAVFPDVSRRLKSSWPAFAGHAGNSTWRCDPMDWKAESAVLRKNCGYDDYEPLQPFVSTRTVDSSIWYEGQLVTVYAQGENVGNTCCVWEGNIPESIGPPPHIHHYEHELFFVLEGSIRAWVEGVPLDVHADSLIFMPAGRIHWFVSTSSVTRMLSFTVTASKDVPSINNNVALFKFIGVPAEALTLPPMIEVKQLPDPVEIVRVTREIGGDIPDLERLGWRRGYGESDDQADASARH